MKFTKLQIINKINRAFINYKKFANKTYIYIYFDNSTGQYTELEVFYGEDNFLHLLGINYKDNIGKNMKAQDFYDFLNNGGQLTESKLQIKSSDTYLKMHILNNIALLDNCTNLRATNKNVSMLMTTYNGMLRTNKAILAIGLLQKGANKIPQSLRNIQKQKIEKGNQVLCIYHPSNGDIAHQVVCSQPSFDNLFKKTPYKFK